MGNLSSPAAQWASFYAKAGFRSFPVWPGEKRPMYAGWQKDATTDDELIGRYFKSPNNNLGLVCGEKFDAWDIEVAHVERFFSWVNEHGFALPESPLARTGRGGIHLLTEPTGTDHTRKLYLEGEHIGELKSTGGFILACPSVTEDMYLWTWLPTNLRLQPAPEWLRTLLERPVTVRKPLPTRLASPDDVVAVLGRLAGSVEHAKEGFRNDYLYWAMRRAVEEGVPADKAQKVLAVAARDAGLTEHEIEMTIGSALTAESVAA